MATLQLRLDAKSAEAEARRFTRATDQVKLGSRGAAGEIERLENRQRSAGKASALLARNLSGLFAGFTAAAAIRTAIRDIIDFEKTMVQVRSVTRATEEQFKRLNQTARQLGATTRFSATETGEGLLFLARAGFSVDEAIAALPATLDFATAGVLELGEAADLASNVLSQFGLAAEDTARVGDALVNTANNSNTSVAQLGEALKLVGPVAGALGRDLEETSAAIGVLGNAGIQASLAGTNLRGVFAALLGPTTEARRQIEALGLSLADVNPETNSAADIFALFRDRGLSASAAVEIFGRRNAAAALILRDNADEIERLTELQDENRGATEKQADALKDTLEGALKDLGSAAKELGLSIGDSGVTGGLKDLVTLVTDNLRFFDDLIDRFNKAKESADLLADALKFVPIAIVPRALADLQSKSDDLNDAILELEKTWNRLKDDEDLQDDIDRLGQVMFGTTAETMELDKALLGAADSTEEASKSAKDYEKALAGLDKTVGEQRIDDFIDSIREENQELRFQIAIVNKNAKEQAKLIAIRELAKKARDGEVEDIKAEIALTVQLIEQNFKLKESLEALESAKGTDVPNQSPASSSSVTSSAGGGGGRLAGLRSEVTELRGEFEGLGDIVSVFFDDLTDGAGSAGDAFRSLGESLFKSITGAEGTGREFSFKGMFEDLLDQSLKALGQFLTGGLGAISGGAGGAGFSFGSAQGNVFSGGTPVPFQMGGVIESPTFFPLGDGRRGVAGEAGSEAIAPLKRNPQGRLGVEIVAGGGTTSTTVNQYIQTPDANSFRASQAQIMRKARQLTR